MTVKMIRFILLVAFVVGAVSFGETVLQREKKLIQQEQKS